MTSKANKLPLVTEPVAHNSNTIWMLKLGPQTFIAPYSADNCSNEAGRGVQCKNSNIIALYIVFIWEEEGG